MGFRRSHSDKAEQERLSGFCFGVVLGFEFPVQDLGPLGFPVSENCKGRESE